MDKRVGWWDAWEDSAAAVSGLVRVQDYDPNGRPPEEVALMERAKEYKADAVFFEEPQQGRHAVAQAFVYGATTLADDADFAEHHRKLWSWGGVPLVYRRTPTLLQLFRCAHKADFLGKGGQLKCNPVSTLSLAAQIELDLTPTDEPEPWWDSDRLRSGTLWTDPETCALLLSDRQAAHKSLFEAFKGLSQELDNGKVLPKRLRRRLLILSLLIAYLEQRDVFGDGFFSQFHRGATRFFEVLRHGPALVELLAHLEGRFNGKVFALDEAEREVLLGTQRLDRFANLIEARQTKSGQLTLWELYSFRDLPVELISQIYQLFVENEDSSVYTPPFLVRFLVEEALSWKTLDRIIEHGQVILDPSCGSGVFLVEAYKRLVLHWRMTHGWDSPNTEVLQQLLTYVHGVDLEADAVELAGFSLCLAMCDALQPLEIRKSIKLFPNLRSTALQQGCFFETMEQGRLPAKIGAVLGNPPFESKLQTPAIARAYDQYEIDHGKKIPDKQAGYLFLHAASKVMEPGAVISMVQQYNFLYNQRALAFRQDYFTQYWVREILDFISVRGLFGAADTKIIVVVAQKETPPSNAAVLHATFRRTGRIDAERGLDLDYYDLHRVPYTTALRDDKVWRANLLGGGRALSLVNRLARLPTLKDFARNSKWIISEGFIVGASVKRKKAPHITGHPYLPSEALTADGIDKSQIGPAPYEEFRSAYKAEHYEAPMLLIREQMELHHGLLDAGYLTYGQRLVGLCAPKKSLAQLRRIDKWMTTEKSTLRAYVYLTSPGLFIQKATSLQADDIYSLPYPKDGGFDLSENERIVIEDIVDYQADLIRLGESSRAMRQVEDVQLAAYSNVVSNQLNAMYKGTKFALRGTFRWSGAICHAYAFGDVEVDWSGAQELQGRIDLLLHSRKQSQVSMTRMCRLYDGAFLFILKPDRLRYWTRSIALRDADDVMADLRAQGY